MSNLSTPAPPALTRKISLRTFAQTRRKGAWWLPSLLTFLGFSAFIVYSTWAAFQGAYYRSGPYLSPFYSPELLGPDGWFGPKPSFWPSWMPFSAALLILWAPGGFRFTCYYYRGAYYKAFWQDPPSCAVGEPRKSYWGEARLPLILQNLHRYFMYIAVIFWVILVSDAVRGFWFKDAAGIGHLGVGVGSLVLTINVVLLGAYLFGCHSIRHLIGGGRDTLSQAPASQKAYDCVTCLNRRHMLFAWCSLFSVGFADIYVRLCSMGLWHDWHWSMS